MRKGKIILSLCCLMLYSTTSNSYAQYINKAYDYDSTKDWGWNIRILPDSNLLIIGQALNTHTNKWGKMWMTIKKDGSQILNKQIIDYEGNANFNEGNSGSMKNMFDSGYLIPMSKQFSHDTTTKGMAGLLRLNCHLDTVFVRTYTDTNTDFDGINDCMRANDGSYYICGARTNNIYNTIDSALLMHIDSTGKLLWIKTYRNNNFYGVDNVFNTLQSLPYGNILVGGSINNLKVKTIGLVSQYYTLKSPWFIIIDTAGNIIKDTVYTSHYGGGAIHKDTNGGYYTWGYLDSFFTNNPLDEQNLPGFVAHLDTNFRMIWVRNFADSLANDNTWVIRQLHDNSYLLIGNDFGTVGWAAKINSITGAILWEHIYKLDTVVYFAYLTDGLELPNGNIVMTGSTLNPNEPNSYNQDVWLLEVDSNGCEVPGCLPTAVNNLHLAVEELRVYPNPTNGAFNVRSGQAGELMLFDMVGKMVAEYKIEAGKMSLQLPYQLTPGLYVGKFMAKDGGMQVVRVVKE